MNIGVEQCAVIVGAGHAAGELATSLRQRGWGGRIVVLGEEQYLPYQRPPLSKDLLAGAVTVDSLYLKPRSTYEDAGVELRLGVRVARIDRAAKMLHLSDGSTLAYDRLALTTGGRVRELALPSLKAGVLPGNLHYLRTIDDVQRLRAQLLPGLRMVIVGGGYIGLEVAAVAVKLGVHVTLLEAQSRVLARVTAPEISAFYERVHRAAGVDVRTGIGLEAVELDESGDAVAAVRCADGVHIPLDLMLVGIGLIPNTELAEAAGLAVDNGIVVDEFCRTSDPDIVAAGDCANHYNAVFGRRMRLESVPNAVEQARCAAAILCGQQQAYNPVPWFWSDQYDLKLQMVGLSSGYDLLVLRGDPAGASLCAFYLKDGLLIAVDAISRPKEFMISKRLVAQRRPIDAAVLADESVPLNSLLVPA